MDGSGEEEEEDKCAQRNSKKCQKKLSLFFLRQIGQNMKKKT
jgi:hypothetical protein